jgi:hypothetical protein
MANGPPEKINTIAEHEVAEILERGSWATPRHHALYGDIWEIYNEQTGKGMRFRGPPEGMPTEFMSFIERMPKLK